MNQATAEQTLDQIEFETRVRYDAQDHARTRNWGVLYLFERRFFNNRRAKPLPPWICPNDPRRIKKAFLIGSERKLRNAVRREKAQYLHEREAQNPDGELAIGADAAR